MNKHVALTPEKIAGMRPKTYAELPLATFVPEFVAADRWASASYEKAGIVPWKNLIVTYDDENGSIDSQIIESEIQNKLL